MSKTKNLSQIIEKSSSSRRFFLSLPVKTQMLLHENSENIKTAEDLHRYAQLCERHDAFIKNSTYFDI